MLYKIVIGIIISLFTIPLVQGAPLAEEIISKDLVVRNQEEYEQKLNVVLAQARTLLGSPITGKSKRDAEDLYNRLDALLTVYSPKYIVPNDWIFKNMLSSLMFVFLNERSAPVDIENIFIPDIHGQFKKSYYQALAASLQKPFTQTGALLSRGEAFNQVLDMLKEYNMAGWHLPAPSFFSKLVEKEKEHRDMYVFYHGQAALYSLFYDLYEAIRTSTQGSFPSDFAYLRFQKMGSPTLAEVLREGFDVDYESEVKNLLLSVNLSLFGGFLLPGESTFEYFLKSFNQTSPFGYTNEIAIAKFLRQLDVDISYQLAKRLSQLYSKYFIRQGTLLQIFMPVDKVNDFAYLSFFKGTPTNCTTDSFWKNCSQFRNWVETPIIVKNQEGKVIAQYKLPMIDTRTYLGLYRNHPTSIPINTMAFLQARILLTDDFMLNPSSGVKIYRYFPMSEDENAEYKKELNDIVAQIMRERKKPECKPLKEPLSQELALTNIVEAEMRISCLVEEAKKLLKSPVNTTTRQEAIKINSLLNTFMLSPAFHQIRELLGIDLSQGKLYMLSAKLYKKFAISRKFLIPIEQFLDEFITAIKHSEELLTAPIYLAQQIKAKHYYMILHAMAAYAKNYGDDLGERYRVSETKLEELLPALARRFFFSKEAMLGQFKDITE